MILKAAMDIPVSDIGKCESCTRQSDVRCQTCKKFVCGRHSWSSVVRAGGSLTVIENCRPCAGEAY